MPAVHDAFFKRQVETKMVCGYGMEMTPKMIYENCLVTLDDMELTVASRVSEEVLMAGSVLDLPVENLAGFNGPNGFFCYAQQKLSEDGKWILIASLAGGLKVPVENLDVSLPIGLICVQGENWRSRENRVSRMGKEWSPMEQKSLGNMRVKEIEGGFKPLSRTIVTRGMDGVVYEYWVVLPSMPVSVKKKSGKVHMECEGSVYILDDPQQVAAVLNGKMTWIVPDKKGNFIFPEYC